MSFSALSVQAREIYSGTDILCIVASSVLAGCLYNSTTGYVRRFTTDAPWHRVVVALLLIVSLISLGSNAGLLFHSFAEDGGTFAGDTGPNIQLGYNYAMLLMATPTFSGVLSQMFFGVRAYRASGRRRWIGVVFGLLTTFHLGFGITALVRVSAHRAGYYGDTPDHASQAIEEFYMAIALAVSAVNDAILAGVLSWSLARRGRTRDARTDALLVRFARAAIATGSLSAVLAAFTAIVTLATFLHVSYFTSPPTLARAHLMGLPDGLLFILPQLYPLLVVATLNLRSAHLRVSGDPSGDRSRSEFPFRHPATPYGVSAVPSLPVAPSAKYEQAPGQQAHYVNMSEAQLALERPQPTYTLSLPGEAIARGAFV